MNPLISIGLPTFNRAKYLKKAILSIILQDYKNIEFIISDNFSTDNTQKICLHYASLDKRIRYIKQNRNMGNKFNFMFVLSKAKGKYFMWFGDDDILPQKNYLSKLVIGLENYPSAVMGLTTLALFDDKNKIKERKPYFLPLPKFSKGFTLAKKYLSCPFLKHPEFFYAIFQAVHKTTILKRSILQDQFILDHCIDAQMVDKLILNGDAIYVPKLLFKKRDTGYFITSTDVLQNLLITKDILRRMIIYLSFPFSFIKDFFIFLPYIMKSRFSALEKIKIIFFSFIRIFVEFFHFSQNIIKAIMNILIGLLNKTHLIHKKRIATYT